MKIIAAEFDIFSRMSKISSGAPARSDSDRGKLPEKPDATRKADQGQAAAAEDSEKADKPASPANATALDPKEQAVLNDLKQTDREVRAHEAAHVAAGGQYVSGGAQFEYQTGPDGKKYAVGGEVGIDSSEVPDDPEATIAKMQVVRRAALAPSQPSSQDRAVAAAAARREAEARMELNKESGPGQKPAEQKKVGGNLDLKA